MSRETQQWLDTMIKVGFTAPEHGRGDAWHRRAGNSNSYPHAVPYDDAYELIAGWEPVQVTPQYETESGEFRTLRYYGGKQPKAIVHSGNGYLLGIHSESYPDHGYKERLFDTLAGILDTSAGDLQIGSCGLLDGYRQAWVQLEMPDTLEHSGERYRPFISAASSLDGSLSSTYFTGAVRAVCDNTLAIGMSNAVRQYKVKNTRNSAIRIESARQALDIVFEVDKEFQAELDRLLDIPVTEGQFDKFIQMYVPLTNPDGTPKEGRGKTIALNKQLALTDLYVSDPMVAPWKGTAWGVQQAVNTYREHYATVRNTAARFERSMTDFLAGKTAAEDGEALKVLEMVLA